MITQAAAFIIIIFTPWPAPFIDTRTLLILAIVWLPGMFTLPVQHHRLFPKVYNQLLPGKSYSMCRPAIYNRVGREPVLLYSITPN